MNRYPNYSQMQLVTMSPMVKRIIIVNVFVWLVLQSIVENLFLSHPYFTQYLSLTPRSLVESFFIWQPLTYMFLHSDSVFHVLLNMISLWFFGSELEYRWGSRSFLNYYFVCGLGAAFVYIFGVVLVGLVQGNPPLAYSIPVLGASGAVFGTLLAYGILFGDRIIYFFGVFPMQARMFILIIGVIEVISLINGRLGASPVANLAHLGGLITGYVYLVFWTQIRIRGNFFFKGRRKFKLVVDNDKKDVDKPPRYWN